MKTDVLCIESGTWYDEKRYSQSEQLGGTMHTSTVDVTTNSTVSCTVMLSFLLLTLGHSPVHRTGTD